MAFTGTLDCVGSAHSVGAYASKGIDAGRRGSQSSASPLCLSGCQAQDRTAGICSTSGRNAQRGPVLRRQAAVFVEKGHEQFYGAGLRGSSRTNAAASHGGGIGDIYQRARELGGAETVDAGIPSQENFQLLSTEVQNIKGRLDSMEKAMRKMKESSSSSSSSSSSESSSSSDDGVGKSVKKALKQEAKRRKADRKAASKGLKGLRARTGALMMNRMEAGNGLQREAAAVGTITAVDVLRAAAAAPSVKGGKVEVCMSGKCRKYGGMDVLQAVNAALPAGSGVEAGPCKCLGKCGSGPNVKVRPEGAGSTLQTHVEPNDVEALLWRHFGLQKNGHVPSVPRIPAVAPVKQVLELVR